MSYSPHFEGISTGVSEITNFVKLYQRVTGSRHMTKISLHLLVRTSE